MLSLIDLIDRSSNRTEKDMSKTHAQIQQEQFGAIFRSLSNKGTAYQQSPAGERIGPHMSAAGALAADIGSGEVDEILQRLFSVVALGYGDGVVAMHARSLVSVLTRDAADMNATAIQNGEAVPVLFKEH